MATNESMVSRERRGIKDCQVIFLLEKDIYDKLLAECKNSGHTVSTFMRSLLYDRFGLDEEVASMYIKQMNYYNKLQEDDCK